MALPELDSAISQRIRAIVGKIRERVGAVCYPSVCVVKDDSTSGNPGLRSAAVQALIHDRGDELRVSYRQFLVKVYGKVGLGLCCGRETDFFSLWEVNGDRQKLDRS